MKQNKSTFNDVFICYKDTLAVLDKFRDGFYVSNKVNFQNYFANKLIKWFVFEAVQNTRSTCFIGSITLGYRIVFKPDKTLLLAFYLQVPKALDIIEHAHRNYGYAVVLQISKFEKKYINIEKCNPLVRIAELGLQWHAIFHFHRAPCGTELF